MTMIEDELNANARKMRIEAKECEKRWRAERNLPAIKRRKCPEPKANVRFRRWCERRMGKFGAASKVRRIKPVTGEVLLPR
jgi:hypothetical protein